MPRPLSEPARQILAVLAADPDAWHDPVDLQAKSGLTRGGYYSYIATLTRRRLVERQGDGGGYRVTPTGRTEHDCWEGRR